MSYEITDEYAHTDFMSFLDATKRPQRKPDDCTSTQTNQARWFGTETFADAETLAINGVTDIETQIRKMAEEFADATGSTADAFATVYAETGDDVDIARYLSGEPEHMMSSVLVPTSGSKVVSLCVNLSANAGVDTSAMIRRGAAACVLADTLERSGYRVEITAVACFHNKGNTARLTVPIKTAGESLDIARVAYALAHPSMLRRHALRYMETLPLSIIRKYGFTSGSGYGSAVDGPSSDYDIYTGVQGLNREFASLDGTRAWIKSEIARLTTQE
jgi:hypothetical protein